MPNFKTYEEASQYIQEQNRLYGERLKQWWSGLTPLEQLAILRAEILSDPELTPFGKQQALKEAEQELIKQEVRSREAATSSD